MENIIVNDIDITDLVTSFESFDEMDKDMIIGSAVSTQIKLKLRNQDDQLKQLLNYPFLIGGKKYIVYEKPEKWTKTISVTLYDYMILGNVGYSTQLEYPTTINNQLDEMSAIMKVNIDKSTLSTELLEKVVGWYDSEMIIRNYLGFIAQCDGKNAFVENDKIIFKKIALSIHETDFCSDYELNEFVIFSRVCYGNGITEPLYKGDDTGHTLYLSSNNLYVDQTDIDRVYSMYNGLSFYSFKKFKTKFDNLGLTDKIIYGDITVMPLSIKKTVYGGEARDSLELSGDIVIKNADAVVVKQDLNVRIKKIQTTIDQVNQTLEIVAIKQDNQQKELAKFELSLNTIESTVEKTQSIVNNIVNSIIVSLNLNYVNSQTYDEKSDKYYPDYPVQNLKITAIATDTLKEVVADAVFIFKRKGQSDEEFVDLIEGETVVDNVLNISHNMIESVEYKAYATVMVEKTTFTAEQSITINLNILNDVIIDESICSIETSSTKFMEDGDRYNPGNIILIPKLFNCNFDLWSYSVDLGVTYQHIELGVVTEDDECLTNAVGITFNSKTSELNIVNDAECFNLTNVVVFKLKGDIEGATNTVVITKDSDIATQVNQIITDINQLNEKYTNVSQELNALGGSITSKVENMEIKYNGEVEEINKKLTQVIQTADSIEEQYTILKEIIDENGSELQTITTYIRKTAKGIEVGEKDANVKTLMGTSYFAILFNDKEVMKLEQNLLTIDRIMAHSSFSLGSSIFTVKSYGFDITWGGN